VVGDVRAVLGDVCVEQRRQVFGRHGLPGAPHRLGQHGAGTLAHQITHLSRLDAAAPHARQHPVQGAQQIGGGIDEGAVEVEDEGGRGRHESLSRLVVAPVIFTTETRRARRW